MNITLFLNTGDYVNSVTVLLIGFDKVLSEVFELCQKNGRKKTMISITRSNQIIQISQTFIKLSATVCPV